MLKVIAQDFIRPDALEIVRPLYAELVRLSQAGRLIATASVSYHRGEKGFDHAADAPVAPPPEDLRCLRTLGADFVQLQWVMNAYTIAVATVLMAAGALADRFGRKRLFLIGVVAFRKKPVEVGQKFGYASNSYGVDNSKVFVVTGVDDTHVYFTDGIRNSKLEKGEFDSWFKLLSR